ncbi:MAG: hypothetical protein ABUT20_32730 [Bacteroidota bacterium]
MENKKVFLSVDKFGQWKEKNGYSTYDQYDFWSTKYGIWSKSLYYKSRIAGSPFIAPIFLAEIFWPAFRKLFVSPKRFPIADAHLIMGLTNIYKKVKDEKVLDEAKLIATELLKSSVDGYSGHCWGYPFNWMTTRGLWTSGIPLITTTGYCFEAFLSLYDETKDKKFFDIAYSIFLFTKKDIKDTIVDDKIWISSYSPFDNSQIVNANAYRSFVLAEGYKRFGDEEALNVAKRNINFILQSQNADGSWLYAVNDQRDAFVDNFHTCFVLKNLYKSNLILNDKLIGEAIKNGFNFYKKNLLDEDGLPIPFAKLPRINIVKRELYDFAEAISLCNSLQKMDEEALTIRDKLLNEVIEKYQKKDGSFVTRVSMFGILNKIPYMRWPQSQLFYALTNCLNN